MEQGEASTSAGTSRGRGSDDIPRGRGRRRREEPEIVAEDEVPELALVSVEAGEEQIPRATWPRGPYLRSDFAKDWDGRNLLLAPEQHISYRILNGKETPHTLELPPIVSTLMPEAGMESWASKVKKVAGGIHKKLWKMANRWRDLAAQRTAEICQSRREHAAVRAKYEEYRRTYGS